MAGKPFVFMHYSNPTKDSKRLENRQKVAKYAMLGRQKQPVTNGHLQPSAAQTTSSTSNGEWSSIQRYSNGRRIELSPDPSSTASTRSTASSTSHLTRSPPTSAYSHETDSPPASNSFKQFLDKPVFGRHDSGNAARSETSEESNSLPRLGGFFESPLDFGDDSNLLFSYNNITSPVFDANKFDRLAEKKRQQVRRRHDQNKALSVRRSNIKTDGDESTSNSRISHFGMVEGDGSHQQPLSPMSLLSASTSDPFNSLPIKANAHTHELLYQYMNARLISSVYAQGSPETFQRIKKMRHTVWWPLCVKSEASLNALVAYVESTPGLPIKSRKRDFLIQHVQAAIEAVRDALSKPNVATDDSICFAVVLLMLTAQREGSTEIYATHAAGLATLLSYRTDAIRKIGEQDNTVQQLQSFYAGEMRNRCRYCQSAYCEIGPSPTLSVSPNTALATDVDSFNAALSPRGEGFRQMIRDGLLSQGMTTFIEPAMIWSTLAERARRDKLSAAIGATHAWIDEGEFTLKGIIHSLDTAVFTAVRLCFYLSSWLDWQHSCSAVRRLAKAVHTALETADIETALQRCPQAMLWLALMVGPLCDNEARNWFSWLLVRSRDILCLQIYEFDTTIELFSHVYVWSHTMTPGAEKFWNQGYFDDAQDGDVFFGGDERIWEL